MFAATFLSNCPRKWSQLLRYCPSTRGPTHSPNYIWLVCPRKRRNTDRKKVLRKRKWRNKSKNWTGSSSSQRMPTNCKAALKKFEESTGTRAAECPEIRLIGVACFSCFFLWWYIKGFSRFTLQSKRWTLLWPNFNAVWSSPSQQIWLSTYRSLPYTWENCW